MNTKAILARVSQQRSFSDEMMKVVLGGLMEVYYPGRKMDEIKKGDIGSYSRGTNVDLIPDLDIAYLDIPADPAQGFVDWSGVQLNLMSAKQGRIDLADMPIKDTRLEQSVTDVMARLQAHFNCKEDQISPNIVRTWNKFPGIVVKLLLKTKDPGEFTIDVNLMHVSSYFGYEHGLRFYRYFDRVMDEIKPSAAAALIEDIRRLKKEAKAGAGRDQYGEVDRRRKVPGFVVEMLFTHRFPPLAYGDVITSILELSAGKKVKPKHTQLKSQTTQVVGEQMSFEDLISHLMESGSITKGGWDLLREIARKGR